METIQIISIVIVVLFFTCLALVACLMYPCFAVEWARGRYNRVLEKQDNDFRKRTEYKPPEISVTNL